MTCGGARCPTESGDMMESVIEIRNITKTYNNGRGVRRITINLERSDVMGILGPNGSGKTTVLKSIVGLVRPTSGEAVIMGHSVATEPEEALRSVGVLIERPALFENLTARKNLETMARIYPNVTDARIDEVLEQVRLRQYSREKVNRFSLGMKQRLGIAMALLSKPEIVILDEPTNGLDIEGTVEIRDLILALARNEKVTFLIASHLAPELEKMCNKICIMHEGEILCTSTIDEALRFNPSLEDFYLMNVRQQRGSALS